MSTRGSPSPPVTALAFIAALTLTLTGCNAQASSGRSGSTAPVSASDSVKTTSQPSPRSATSAARLTANVAANATDVTVDTPVSVRVKDGTLNRVVFKVHQKNVPLAGSFNADHTRWTAKNLLEPGTRYVVSGRATDPNGVATSKRIPFRTQDLSLDQQTYASVIPLQNEVVGVGMPVIVQFDVPVTNRAAVERRMHVTASPATKGSWHWMSDTEVHWRPKTFWKSGTTVHVNLKLNGVNAGNGIYGQMDRSVDFRVGRSVIMKPNVRTDQMKVLLDGRLARTIPITGGQPGFETRSGIKLIVEKFKSLRMNAATVGIQPGSPNYYNIANVQYAQRVTFSGEFLHAAPWSVYAQGSSNVSHGCVGMSTANAAWLFSRTHRGDPVMATGTSRGMEPGNGWTDWNESFASYQQGSAL